MTQGTVDHRRHSNAYHVFILVLTIIALVIMVLMFLPIDNSTIGLLQFYDNLICVIFLIDFGLTLRATSNKSEYFFKERGWLDLLGSIPSMGVTFKYSGLLRLARLSQFARILRILRAQRKEALVRDVVKHRSQYIGLVTVLLTIIVLASASVLVLQFESQSPEALITTGWDAFWYSIVTITTVGYGDYYPVTFWGRVTAMFIMFAGIGIIGALASLLSSILIGTPATPSEEALPVEVAPTVEQDIAAIKAELVALRRLLETDANTQ